MNAHEKPETQAATQSPPASPAPPAHGEPPGGRSGRASASQGKPAARARRAILLLYGLMALFIAVPVVIFLARR